jgi:hypothetical protein
VQWSIALVAFRKAVEFREHKAGKILSSKELVYQGRKLLKEFQALWRMRNKESELKNVTATFNAVFKRISTL